LLVAVDTYTIEALMQDGKAFNQELRTSWVEFAKAFDVTFMTRDERPITLGTHLGVVSTRLMGALIMTSL
jgi:prolyl-tRNA synthetase